MQRFDPRVFMTAVRLEAGENVSGSFSLACFGQLLKLDDEAFLAQAYRIILGRDIDAPGLAAYKPLAAKMRGRVRILLALLLSPERIILPERLRMVLKTAAKLARPGKKALQSINSCGAG